jgi:hypothetical protein
MLASRSNLLQAIDGQGHRATLHAELPVTSGMKTGLNIWTWEKASKLKAKV